MKELIRRIIGRYIKLNPSLSDEGFVEMLSSEIADELEIMINALKGYGYDVQDNGLVTRDEYHLIHQIQHLKGKLLYIGIYLYLSKNTIRVVIKMKVLVARLLLEFMKMRIMQL